MRIIGHRGAAGLAPGNSLASLRAAKQHHVDAIEFDVRMTADGQIVLLHKTSFLPHKPLPSFKEVIAQSKYTPPTLDEALKSLVNCSVIIDVKDHGMAAKLAMIIKKYPKVRVSFASFLQDELRTVHKAVPTAPIYVLDHFSPVDIISSAQRLGANGIGLNKWLMNPLTYRLAKRQQLQIFVYTINSRFLERIFRRLYPDAAICTDHPERFLDGH